MQIVDLRIRNFKSIREVHIEGIENALILVGKNNTGKTAVLDAIRAVCGDYTVQEEDFQEDDSNVEIFVSLKIEEEDLGGFTEMGKSANTADMKRGIRISVRNFRLIRMGQLSFEFVANKEGKIRYGDGYQKHNSHIPELFPKVYYMDAGEA